ncbi:unnamed protein product [Ectocarpus sp. 6 AP-2014]
MSTTTSPEPDQITTARIRVQTFYKYRREGELVHDFIRKAEVQVATYEEMQRQRSVGAPLPAAAATGGGGGRSYDESRRSVNSAMQGRESLDESRPAGDGLQQPPSRTPATTLLPTPPPAGIATQHAHTDCWGETSRPPPGGSGRQRLAFDQSHHVHRQPPPPLPGVPPSYAVHHANRNATQFNEGIEDLLDTLAEGVLVRHPSVGYMRMTIAVYLDLKRRAPGKGALAHILAVARISNGSAKTFERNMKLLEDVGTVLNEADFFTTASRLEAGLGTAASAAISAPVPASVSTPSQGSASSSGT